MTHEIDHTIDIDAIAKKLANGMTLEQLRGATGGNLSSGSIPPLAPLEPKTERGRKHLASLNAETRRNAPTVRDLTQSMEWEVARRKVWALFQIRAAHISQIEDRDFDWVFDESESRIIRNMTRYFINDRACEWPLTKGLFVYGMPGTGKTEILQVFERFCRENDLPKQFQFTSMAETYVTAKADKNFNPITQNVQLDRCFDEFGLYTGAVMTFGESLDINEAILEARYKRFRHGGQLTHLISNMTTAEIQKTFTPMIFDRIKQMCTSVLFNGKSKRV
jgi:hypothetical protein